MTVTQTTDLEPTLIRDLDQLGDSLADQQFSAELYRALTNRRWRKEGGPEGAVTLSWSRAEEVVNEFRARRGREPLSLAQSGGEGELSAAVEKELGAVGWRSEPLNTGRHDDAHVGRGGEPAPRG
jgi:hypothetical protein